MTLDRDNLERDNLERDNPRWAMSSPGEAGIGDAPEAASSDKNNNQQVEASAEATPTVDTTAPTAPVAEPLKSPVRAEGDDDGTAKADGTPRVPPEYIRLREDFETHDDLVMAICHGFNNDRQLERGLRQGRCLTPPQFNIYTDGVARRMAFPELDAEEGTLMSSLLWEEKMFMLALMGLWRPADAIKHCPPMSGQ